MPAAPVDPVVRVLGGRGEESFPAHAGGAGPSFCCPLLQERGRYSRKRLSNVCSVMEKQATITKCVEEVTCSGEICIRSEIVHLGGMCV